MSAEQCFVIKSGGGYRLSPHRGVAWCPARELAHRYTRAEAYRHAAEIIDAGDSLARVVRLVRKAKRAPLARENASGRAKVGDFVTWGDRSSGLEVRGVGDDGLVVKSNVDDRTYTITWDREIAFAKRAGALTDDDILGPVTPAR